MTEDQTAQQDPSTFAPTPTMARLVSENENLRRKLETQPVIEQAKGILMVCYGVSSDEAFELLRRWSQDTNTKLHQVALSIVDARWRGEPIGWTMPFRARFPHDEASRTAVPATEGRA